MTPSPPFWVDHRYDQDQASDRRSRYGAYLRKNRFEPWTDQDQHIEFAAYAWRVATGPIMAPGYVRRHPRILSAQLERSDWDGKLIASVDLITGRPASLERKPGWRGWPTETMFASDGIRYMDPCGEDLTAGRYMLPSVSLRFAVTADGLPPAPPPDSNLFAPATQAVAALVSGLNVTVGPVLAALEGE